VDEPSEKLTFPMIAISAHLSREFPAYQSPRVDDFLFYKPHGTGSHSHNVSDTPD
jgi:hypothetical protein